MGNRDITVSLNPTYLCNFRCDFCYLTPEQLADKKKLSIERLKEMMAELRYEGYRVSHVDLYGGEVGLLDEDYLLDLEDTFWKEMPTVNIITNLSVINPYFLRENVDLSVSYDFSARQAYEKVYENMMMTDKDLAVLILASPEVLAMDVDDMIDELNMLSNVVSVEIKPYSTNQANQHQVSFKDFEEFIKKWIDSPVEKNFSFENQNRLERSLSGEYDAFSSNHVYITPDGKWGALEFDDNDNEFFLEFESIKEYEDWAVLENARVHANSFCSKCEYLGKCLTEHYRNVTSLDNSCNGFKHLLDWYKVG